MSSAVLQYQDSVIFERAHLDRMVELLLRDGYQLFGPTVKDGAIVYDEVSSAGAFPAGWGDTQSGWSAT